MNNLAPIEDKELEEIFDRFVQPGTRYVNDIMDELLSWRDNHQKALYQRLAAEAETVEFGYPIDGEYERPAISIDKLKAIMEIKE